MTVNPVFAQTHSQLKSSDGEYPFPNIGISNDGGHHHGESDSMPGSPFKDLAAKIKSVDGFDEAATILGQVFPDAAGSIAAGSILVFATPLVWLGVSGMRSEYQQARGEFIRIAKLESSASEKLRKLAANSEKWQKYLSDQFGIQHSNIKIQNQQSKAQSKDLDIAIALTEYQSAKNQAFVTELANKFGWTGMSAMSGMLGGMLLGSAASALEVSMDFGLGAVALEGAASALELSAGAVFIPAQLFMSAYALNRKRQGKRLTKVLEQNISTINAAQLAELSVQTLKNIRSIINMQKFFTKKHSISYGNQTAVGQSLMLTGTALGMTGAGLAITAPAFLLGGPLTIGPAIKRIRYSNRVLAII